jgi:hypothetical protein
MRPSSPSVVKRLVSEALRAVVGAARAPYLPKDRDS